MITYYIMASKVYSIKEKIDVLLSMLNQDVNKGTATITVSGDLKYDDDGITIDTENVTNLKIDPITQKFAVDPKVPILTKTIDNTKILYRK